MIVQSSYLLVIRDLLSGFSGDLSGETGETVYRRTQRPNMVEQEIDIFDENGEPTGETKIITVQKGWIIGGETGDEVEEVPVAVGGYSLIGRWGDYSAVRIKSPNAELLKSKVDEMIQVDPRYSAAYIELHTWDINSDNFGFDNEFIEYPSLTQASLFIQSAYGIPLGETAVEKINSVITLPIIGANPVTGTTNKEIIEGIFTQVVPNWKIGR